VILKEWFDFLVASQDIKVDLFGTLAYLCSDKSVLVSCLLTNPYPGSFENALLTAFEPFSR